MRDDPAGMSGGEEAAMLENYGWLAWLGVALALAAIEAATVDFVFIMLAGGALGGSAAAAVGAPFPVQALVAVAVSGILLGVVRPWAKARFNNRVPGIAMGTASYIGRPAFVVETVTQHGGRVKVGGETWSAKTADAVFPEPGDEVRVVRIDGATAVVTSASNPIGTGAEPWTGPGGPSDKPVNDSPG